MPIDTPTPKQVAAANNREGGERIYPCERCGKLRTKDEGGTTFTVCDECWEAKREPAKTVREIRAERADNREGDPPSPHPVDAGFGAAELDELEHCMANADESNWKNPTFAAWSMVTVARTVLPRLIAAAESRGRRAGLEAAAETMDGLCVDYKLLKHHHWPKPLLEHLSALLRDLIDQPPAAKESAT